MRGTMVLLLLGIVLMSFSYEAKHIARPVVYTWAERVSDGSQPPKPTRGPGREPAKHIPRPVIYTWTARVTDGSRPVRPTWAPGQAGPMLVNGLPKNSKGGIPNNRPHPSSGPALGPNNWEPYFDFLIPTNITSLVGKSAYLSCRVRNLGNKTVSWIRHRDIHILTVGSYTYTSDQRFQANHILETDEWTLQIKWAQKRDAGVYECQVSTQPVTSYFVVLEVVDDSLVGDEPTESAVEIDAQYEVEIKAKNEVEIKPSDISPKKNAGAVPTAEVLGGPDMHVDKGSTINLTCYIQFSLEPPAYIFWYHEEEVISYDSSRGGVSVITEKGDTVTTSFLLIQHADMSDSGKYTCSPSNADIASIKVHVLNGERPAAMQTGSSGLSNSFLTILATMLVSYIYGGDYLNLHSLSKKRSVASR